MMKKYSSMLLFALIMGLVVSLSSAFAATPGTWAIGVRNHTDHSIAEDIPFGDGDLSYQGAYEIHDAGGIWQFALGLTPDISERDNDDTNVVPFKVDQVITPELNLLMEDQTWIMGVGALMSYVEQEDEEGKDETEWTDIYWQLIFGLQLPLSPGSSLKLLGYYPYEDWSDLSDIDFNDVDFGAWLTLRF